MEGGPSVVISPLMEILRDSCKSHHDILVGDRRRLSALDVDDIACALEKPGMWSWKSRVGPDHQLSVFFQEKGGEVGD